MVIFEFGLADFLLSKGVPTDVVENFKTHGIDRGLFLSMSEDHLKEIAPRIVDRITLQKIASDELVSHNY